MNWRWNSRKPTSSGADVIKVENPGSGDQVRQFGKARNGASLFSKLISRNKKSITLNLREPKGQDLLCRLIAATRADVLVGLDVNLAGDALASGLFAAHGADLTGLALPVDWDDPVLAPFDWGHFAFVYDSRRLVAPPVSFEALLDAPDDLKIVIQDPRSSTPGLGLLMWVRAVYGDRAPEVWRRLKPKILTVTKGWWESYSMFLEGEADMVLSYTTSPAYHEVVDKEGFIRAAPFDEGHYLQMELAAVTAASTQPELARRFIAYLTDEAAQSAIPTTNWMFPVNPQAELPDAFGHVVKPARTLSFPAGAAQANRKAWIGEWLAVMGE